MDLRPILPLLALLAATTCFAQNEVIREERIIMIMEEAVDPDEPLPFLIVEQKPEFPGGDEAMIAYIGRELKYPPEAVKHGNEGVVYVRIIVERDGSISDAKVFRGIGYGCDEEARRVVKGMPNWSPGMQRGRPVRVQYDLPIRFEL